MNYHFCAIILLWLAQTSLCQQCPAVYLRYSKEHSYCKPVNSACPIYHSGVTSSDRMQIVDLHNKYRSLLATGKEKQAGGLPEASDMLQMVWDAELAAGAQRTAEQCIYAHDCSNCRRVENFPVGQNIAFLERQCTGEPCPLNSVPDWSKVIKMFYDEVAVFDKNLVKSMAFIPGRVYGHFTQLVWSETWRVGCGYVAFRKEKGYRQLYFCNYGPGGNIVNTPMYKPGPLCSACPLNSCCGSSCEAPNYPGLCRMNNNDEAPVYQSERNYIFYCDFRTAAGDCETSVDGANKWKYMRTLGDSFAEIVLKGGEKSTLKFKRAVRPKQAFCLIVKYRCGPAIYGQISSNAAVLNLEIANTRPMIVNLPYDASKNFFEYKMNLNWRSDTKLSFTFSVPQGVPDQYFNIQLVAARLGACRQQK